MAYNLINIKVTDTQKANLRNLADYLNENNPVEKFDMEQYMAHRHNGKFTNVCVITSFNLDYYNRCDTVACAAGHGPIAGITDHMNTFWNEYIYKNFTNFDYNLFLWLFDRDWKNVDNTPKGAAARIYFFLENGGIPENYWRQMTGEVPLSYTVL